MIKKTPKIYFSDEMADITWIQAFHLILQLFSEAFTDDFGLSDDKIEEMLTNFIDAIPLALRKQLKAA